MIGVRRLPLRVQLVVGESFASYLDRLASELDVPLSRLLRVTGLLRESEVFPANYGVSLQPEQVQNLAYATRLDPAVVTAALLTRYEGLAFASSSDGLNRRRAHKHGWAYFNGSHFCPACISENRGAWLLAWKLPWSYACTRHGTLLLDQCPRCGGRPGAGPNGRPNTPATPSCIPQPGICSNTRAASVVAGKRRATKPCRQTLASLIAQPLEPFERLMGTQRQLDDALAGHQVRVAGSTQTTREYFDDLRHLCLLILLGGEREDLGQLPTTAVNAFALHVRMREQVNPRPDRRQPAWTLRHATVPKSASLMAAILPTATEWLAVPSVADLTRVLTPTAERARERLGVEKVSRILPLSSRLAAALEPGRPPTPAKENVWEPSGTIDLFGVFEASVVLAVERSRLAKWLAANDEGQQTIAPPVTRLKCGPIWTPTQIRPKLAELYQLRTGQTDEDGMHAWALERSLADARRRGIDPSEVERLLAAMR